MLIDARLQRHRCPQSSTHGVADAGHRLERAQDSARRTAAAAAPAPGFRLAGPAPAAPPAPASAPVGDRGAARPAGHRRSRRRTGGGARFGEASRCWIGSTSCACGLLDGAVPLAALQGLRSELGRAAGLDGDAAPARAPGGDRRALRGGDRQAGGRGARSADRVSWRTMSQRPRGSRHRRRTCRNLPPSDRRSGARRHAPDCARSMRTRIP